MPGFVDLHVHLSLPDVLILFPFIAPGGWSLPSGEFPGVKTHKEYLNKLKKHVSEYKKIPYYSDVIPFITRDFINCGMAMFIKQSLMSYFLKNL